MAGIRRNWYDSAIDLNVKKLIRKEVFMRFRSAAIDQLARMICGDNPLPFPYRSSSALTAFFTGLGLDYVHDGSSRNPWARAAIQDLNRKCPEDGPFPSEEMVSVIEELMHPSYFDEARPHEKADYDQALDRINRNLKQYELEVVEDSDAGMSRLISIDGDFVSTSTVERAVVRTITFAPSVFEVPDAEIEDDLVSVMMPFDEKFTKVYNSIKETVDDLGLYCRRADDIWENSAVIQDVFTLIFRSFIVVCDFTDFNPNVFYETGIAHTLGKHVIPITQSSDKVPFDLGHHRFLHYLNNTEGRAKLKTNIKRRLNTLIRQRDNA